MSTAHVSESDLLRLNRIQLAGIKEVLGFPGPSITLLVPPYRPGEQSKSAAVVLNSMIKEAAAKLAAQNVPESIITNLLQPLRQLASDRVSLAGVHWGRVIFRSPDVFRQFQVTGAMTPSVTVSNCFSIRPLLAELHLPAEFYLLAISKKRVALLRCTGLEAEAVDLPKGIPGTLEEALALEPPDHDLMNRSTAGSSLGDMRGVRFGTGSGRERQHSHLADFYKIVDRGMNEFLRDSGAKVVLVGVEEDVNLYRSVNTYPKLAGKSVHGSPESFAYQPEMLSEAYAILRAASVDEEAKALAESRERVAPSRFGTDPLAVVCAAAEGRVGRLFVDDGPGTLAPDGSISDTYRLLNVAAVEVILHGGQAFGLPADRMVEGAAVAAIFRY